MTAAITYKLRKFDVLEKELASAPELVRAINRDALGHAVELVSQLGGDTMPTGPGHFGYHAKERFSTTVTPLATTGIVAIDAPQARWLEGGTAAHEIPHPLGETIITIHHPGQEPRWLMKKTLRRAANSIKAMFQDAIREKVQAMADRINSGQ